MTRELFPGGCRPPGKRSRPKPGQQEHEILMGYHLKELHLDYFREYLFHERRRWRFDFAVPSHMLAIEIQGGIHGFNDSRGKKIMGGHSRGVGYQEDMYKHNEAVILGWTVLPFSVQDVMTGLSKNTILRWLKRDHYTMAMLG